jgi:3-dehydroquinate dehydratase/shikimate dehydrogenase
MVQMEMQEAAKQGARLIELRLDYLRKAPDFHRLLASKPCPLVATVRRLVDGGKWDGGEEARLTLLRQCIVAGFDWVDLETDVLDGVRRFGEVRRINSYHNFREVPADLEKVHERMCQQDCDVVKIAVRAQHPSDNLRLLALLKNPPKPTVAFCMGDLGFLSRILQAKYGAPFTYAAFNKERNIAPGMPALADLKKVYFYDHINAATRVYALIGDPVAHSLSPLIHNPAFRKVGLNAVYVPIRVSPADLPEFLKAFERIPVEGYSVTIPHKEAAAQLAKVKDSAVQRTRAANTLLRSPEGFKAANTDYHGFIDALNALLPTFMHNPALNDDPLGLHLPAGALARANVPSLPGTQADPTAITTSSANITTASGAALPSHAPVSAPALEMSSVQSKVALVLGAGGVARAAAHALHREGALVTVTNRTPERGQALASEIGCRFVDWNSRHTVLCDIVVNCTSVGMHPNLDESPLHPSYFKPGLVVFDTVYTPEQTLLIKEARERGCHVITGVELFVRQAARQSHLFTGREAPLEFMRGIVKRALLPVAIKDEASA